MQVILTGWFALLPWRGGSFGFCQAAGSWPHLSEVSQIDLKQQNLARNLVNWPSFGQVYRNLARLHWEKKLGQKLGQGRVLAKCLPKLRQNYIAKQKLAQKPGQLARFWPSLPKLSQIALEKNLTPHLANLL